MKTPAIIDLKTAGLNQLFKVSFRLPIRKIHHLKCFTSSNTEQKNISDGGIFCYQNHIVNRVEIMGIVVRVDRREKHNSYAVDDGTGVINCTCWKNSRISSCSKEFSGRLPQSLQSKFGELIVHNRTNMLEGYDLGDLVLMCGRVTVFRDRREINVLYHRRIDNPNAEVERMSKMSTYRKVYDEPFMLSPNLEKQFVKNVTGNSLPNVLERAILQILNNPVNEKTELDPKEMLSWSAISSVFQSHEKDASAKIDDLETAKRDALETLTAVLLHLESSNGCVLSRPGQIFEVIRPGCPLANKVMAIINEACTGGKNAERGCHRLQVEDTLRRSRVYSSVPACVVTYLLDCLETSSDLFMSEPQRYMALQT
ncbi:CST complex subunit STN1-like isoform X3 [Biomphalaria glabrata]|nr:CST complex subunit STN1-like isoform X3 [Biomphalaria glabrata]XP_055862515.1 CST complex subunit STN1-like isoform X3 [Biomphalaria glabrata]